MAAGLPSTKSALTPLAKSVLLPLGVTAAASATDTAIQLKIFGSCTTALIISDQKMDDVLKIVKSVGESGLLIKGVSEIIKNETKKQKGRLLGTLLGTFGASLFGNMLAGKGVIRAGEGTIRGGERTIRAGEGINRAGQDF